MDELKFNNSMNKQFMILKSRQVGKSYMNSMNMTMNMIRQMIEYRKFSRCQSIKKIFNI